MDDDGAHVIRGLLVAANEQRCRAMVEAQLNRQVCGSPVTLTPLSTLGALADPLAPNPEAPDGCRPR